MKSTQDLDYAFITEIKVFIEMVGEVPTKELEKELVKSIDDLNVVGRTKELNARLDGSKSVVEEGLKWIISRFELRVRETIYKKADDRSNIEVMPYNFVDEDVPEIVKKLLKNGIYSVSSTRLTKHEIDLRVENALLEYVNRLARKCCFRDIQDWLKKMKIFVMDEDFNQFVEKLEERYPALKAELDYLMMLI